MNYNLTHSLIGRPFLLTDRTAFPSAGLDWKSELTSDCSSFGPSSNSSQSSTASSTDVNESPNDASGDSSHSETKQNSVSGDDIIFADADTDEVLLFAGADVTTYCFAEIMNALQTVNNEPLAGMHRIVEVIKTLLPPSSDEHKFPSANQLRSILLKKIPRVRRIHVCAQDCVMFIGECMNLKRCPKCSRLRYFRNKAGKLCPVNVFRSIPLVEQLRLKFNRPESARAMRLSKTVCAKAADDETIVCDITESIGFKETVFDSNFMTDSRNLVLLMGTDGVNPFARERVTTYSLWPIVFFVANLSRDVRYKVRNALLGGLVSGHVYVDGVKKNRSVKNLNLYIDYFVKELLQFNEDRVKFVDASYPVGSPRRVFSPSVMLLGVMGDYDALCHVMCTVSAGNVCCCIKCNIKGVWYASVSTRVFAQHRRYLDAGDPRRSALIRHEAEFRVAPKSRTREQAISYGMQAEELRAVVDRGEWGAKAALDRHVASFGVKSLCALTRLPEFDPYDRAFLDYMHLIKNIAWNHLVKRMLGLTKNPAVPKNEMKAWSEVQRANKTAAALQARDAKFDERQARVELLQTVRDQILKEDALWEIQDQQKRVASDRMKSLVCPVSFYTHHKNLFEFTGCWDTIDWHHFIERWGIYALFGCVDTSRYELVVDLFGILAALALPGHTRNQLRLLLARAVNMLTTFEEIGPLQEHTNMFHLIIELIKQSMRWGPPSSVWCYVLERIMGNFVRGIKSKRHAEANIMSRYRNTLIPCGAFSNPRFEGLRTVLSQAPRAAAADKFPTRMRDGTYSLLPSDFEDLHAILRVINQCYRRVARECGLVHSGSVSPGHDMQKWRPWLAPIYMGSLTWLRRNSMTLASAVTAFQVPRVKIVYSGVFHGGERRTGCKKTVATSNHEYPHAIFKFNESSEFSGTFGKILFMFRLYFADNVITEQEMKQPYHFAKVQLLEDCGFCPHSRLPVVCMNDGNDVKVVLLRDIGEVTVIGIHPDASRAVRSHYLVLPWPRRANYGAEVDIEE